MLRLRNPALKGTRLGVSGDLGGSPILARKKEPSYNDSGKQEIREERATLARGDETNKKKG